MSQINLKDSKRAASNKHFCLIDFTNNPDKYVYPFVIKERNKERTIITYNKGKSYGGALRREHEALLEKFNSNFVERNLHSFAYHKGVRCLDALDDHLESNHFIKLDFVTSC